MRRIAFFEDRTALQFGPLTQLRPVFELLCGHYTVRERTLSGIPCDAWGACLRPELAEAYCEAHPEAHINNDVWMNSGPLTLINGRWLFQPREIPDVLPPGTAGWIGDTLVFLTLDGERPIHPDQIRDPAELASLAYNLRHVAAPGTLTEYPWDLIARNPEMLCRDFESREHSDGCHTLPQHVAVVGDSGRLFVHRTAKLDPYVVIDVTQGPVWIDAGARIQAFTRIEGPSYIGRETQLFRANVREGCSFGPVCRIGGEIEESIILGHSNKYHDGFLGHSYVAEWVNLGALTTNSDLKNDYTDVSVPLCGEKIETGSKKVGCFIGDHTKTALASLFNTGTSVGVMSLILPGGELLPKHIPSFSRVWHGRVEPLPDGVESGLHTARYAMSRRGRELTPAMERLIRHVHQATEPERRQALARQDRKQELKVGS